jgi:hypothetical protein
MNERKVQYIDVGNMSEKELCQLLDIEYVPWYKSTVFWALEFCLAMPSIILIFGALK